MEAGPGGKRLEGGVTAGSPPPCPRGPGARAAPQRSVSSPPLREPRAACAARSQPRAPPPPRARRPTGATRLWGPDLGGGHRREGLAAPGTPLLTCLAPTGLASAAGAAQDRFHVPEPPSHVEEARVSGGRRELPERDHVRLGQRVALDVATRAEVLVQGLHPGGLVTNAQDGPVGGSCRDRRRASVGGGGPGRGARGARASCPPALAGTERRTQTAFPRGWRGVGVTDGASAAGRTCFGNR